jgi:hypothetical protein
MALVASLRDITATLAGADPPDKATVYEAMGIDVTYHQDGRILLESRPRVVSDGVGGPIPVLATGPASRHWLLPRSTRRNAVRKVGHLLTKCLGRFWRVRQVKGGPGHASGIDGAFASGGATVVEVSRKA